MQVKLIAKTIVVDQIPGYIVHEDDDKYPTDADDLGEMAGRLCYLAWWRKNFATAENKGYLANIILQGHLSVLEHSSVSFYIDGVTRAFLLELERHRHLSYSVVSQRYVDSDEFGMVEHPMNAKLSDELKAEIAAHDAEAHVLYRKMVAEHEGRGWNRKVARGAARLILPEGTETRLLVSGNLRAWMEVLWKRLSSSADAEICEVSKLILAELKMIAPNTFQNFE